MTEPLRPLLLVDIDGVINAVGSSAVKRVFEATFKKDGWKLRVPAGTKERFERLAVEFDCVWATTWEEDAPIVGRHAGFGMNWPWITFEERGTQSGTWKLPDIERWCLLHARGRPLAWVDDDLESDVDDWAVRRGMTLIVKTRPEEGLTEKHTDMLLAWAREQVRGTD